MKTIITKPGEIIDFETVFVENPAISGNPAPKRVGRVERVDYTTDVYEDGVTYPKYCNVYLPYCYDPEDKSRKYNVLYYQHGNTCDPEIFTGEEQKKFDALFDSGEIDPCIIVSITYYFDVTKDVEERRATGAVPAGDGHYPGIKGNYYREVIEDIIPAVEMKYNTYLTGTSKEEIIAARDHRAFTGYSRGCVCTWYMFHHALPYFRWYSPMSCHVTVGRSVHADVTQEEVMDYILKPIHENPDYPFYIYAATGGPEDVGARRQYPQMKFITKAEPFSYGTDTKKNNIYFSIAEFDHTDLLVPYYYYNSLQVLFKL